MTFIEKWNAYQRKLAARAFEAALALRAAAGASAKTSAPVLQTPPVQGATIKD